MSTPPAGKLPLPELAAMKRRGDKIVMVTAYDMPGARFAEDAGIDMLLVGDTRGDGRARPRGHDRPGDDGRDALPDAHRRARSAHRPIVVGDMPFGSYQVSDEDAVRNAIRFVKEARRRRRQARGRGTDGLARRARSSRRASR